MMKPVKSWINLKIQKENNRDMKKYIVSILIFCVGFVPIMGQSLVEKANAEYDKDKYSSALELYLQAAKDDGTSSDLYYNIGNTYYRMGDLGRAVLNYERALILDPSNEDVKTNLEFVNSKIQTKIIADKSFIIQVADDFVGLQTSNAWATLSVICFILLIAGILLYVFSSTILLRKIGFFGGGIMAILVIVSLICSFAMKSRVEAGDKAIVVSPSVTLSTVPRIPKDKTEEAFILTSGNKITIVDSVVTKAGEVQDVWYDVKADNTHRAWLKREHIEKI